jgi:hypothetical protein
MYDIFFISDNKDLESFQLLKERFPLAKIVDNFEEAKKRSFTKFFWCVWPNLIIDDNFNFDYQVADWDKDYVHLFKNGDFYDGVCLFSKQTIVSKREVEYRFFISKKEIDIVASTPKPFDKFYINSYSEYLQAVETTTSEMFWIIWNDVVVEDNFNFDYYIPQYDSFHRNITHIFKNGDFYDGICLFSKNKPVTKKEFEHRFFISKNEIDIVASTPKPFDIVFISYNESQADQNYNNLKSRFPRAKRIHGITGIHQAHIEAAKLATTDMFWVVDADAVIEDTFNFEFEHIPFYSTHSKNILTKIVHVWHSRNPVTGLEYGYGGVKLLPKKLTLEMDITTTDMTTSISDQFKVMQEVSNITAFNIDAFSTWRSAFRECVKLSVNADPESLARLNAWCVLNESVEYGFYAYLGALAGRAYGEKSASDKEALGKINDFIWLQDLWLKEKSQLSLEHMQ